MTAPVVLAPEALEVAARAVLRAQLLTVAGLPRLRQWEGQPFTPPMPPAPWLRESTLRDDGPQRVTLGESPLVRLTGQTQVSLFWPVAPGAIAAAETCAAAIRAAFRDTAVLTRTDGPRTLRLRVVEVALASPLLDRPGYVHVPVTLAWTADAVLPTPL